LVRRCHNGHCKEISVPPNLSFGETLSSFPLGVHKSGKSCKQVGGHLYYFGRIDDWEGALKEWEHAEPYLRAGKTPPPNGDTLSLADVSNLFLEFKDQLVQSGEFSRHTFIDYRETCQRLCDHLGKRRAVKTLVPADF
jgi:hypothetical protein